MERRKSQLEINNDLVNKEIKNLFNQESTKSRPSQNIAIIDSSMYTGPNHQKQTNLENVNFNNAVFNKNFIPMQNMTHNETSDSDTPTFNSNLNTTDVFVNDDISLLPIIDEKTILSTLKAKFEMRKFYVNFNHLI